MKKFNINKAKQGHPLITKGGKDAKILYYERNSKNFPLVVIIDNKEVACYSIKGKLYIDKESDKDLMLK